MSKEYTIPSEMKREAEKQAREIGIRPDSIHHICPRSLAKKYNLPKDKIVSLNNAIGLEQEFHDWIHHGDEVFGIESDFKGLEEDDYIVLAIALLGLAESDFDEGNIHQSRANRSRKEKTRRRKGRRNRR
jgi:hypothetical protein